MRIDRKTMMDLIYGGRSGRRFTQDSPVLPDVWIAFAQNPNKKIDLLLTPFQATKTDALTPGLLEQALRKRLPSPGWPSAGQSKRRRQKGGPATKTSGPRAPASIAHNQSAVVGLLSLDEVVRIVLPMSSWWTTRVCGKDRSDLLRLLRPRHQRELVDALVRAAELTASSVSSRPSPVRTEDNIRRSPSRKSPSRKIREDVLWMVRLIGTLLIARDARPDEKDWVPPEHNRADHFTAIVKAVAALLGDAGSTDNVQAAVYSVSLNRQARLAIWRSSTAVKADAVRRLFNVRCAGLAWALIDSGIDATHPAFRVRRPGADGIVRRAAEPFSQNGNGWTNNTRVLETYDFRIVRQVLAGDMAALKALPGPVSRLLKREWGTAEELRKSLQSGRTLDWGRIAPLLRIPHEAGRYRSPGDEHGTHVAGILAADWPASDDDCPQEENVTGICPDLSLYDLRAFDDDGVGDEFTVMAALQFVRHLNANKDFMAVHGVNLSVSIPHDIANYACGATPVCVEAERLVGAGIVVVAAAGNDGYLHYVTTEGAYDGYQSISVTDPGNAEAVITVGATHRDSPHTYGVSYFSSRGPTGDGRNKPDLVAPGEKIEAPIPGPGLKRMDGTSMAAPHVSGAAAMLLARYSELVGRPVRIKEILCSTATDLGRERYFQGAGMLDVLRAMQSV